MILQDSKRACGHRRGVFTVLAFRAMQVAAPVILFSGCVRLTPQPDQTRFFILKSAAPVTADGNGLRVGLARIGVPSYLASGKIAIRNGMHEVTFSEMNRWTEALNVLIEEVVADNLASRSGIGSVQAYPWQRPRELDRIVDIHIQEFGGRDSGDVVLIGMWTIATADRTLLRRADFDLKRSWTRGNYETLTAAMNGLANQLCDAVAAELAIAAD